MSGIQKQTFSTALGTLKENLLTYVHYSFSDMFVINEDHFEEMSLNNILWNFRILSSFNTSSTFALSIFSLVPWFSLGRWVGCVGNGHGSYLKEELLREENTLSFLHPGGNPDFVVNQLWDADGTEVLHLAPVCKFEKKRNETREFAGLLPAPVPTSFSLLNWTVSSTRPLWYVTMPGLCFGAFWSDDRRRPADNTSAM